MKSAYQSIVPLLLSLICREQPKKWLRIAKMVKEIFFVTPFELKLKVYTSITY